MRQILILFTLGFSLQATAGFFDGILDKKQEWRRKGQEGVFQAEAHRIEVQKAVDFWTSIYTQYSIREGVVHDAKYLDIVYEKVNLRGLSKRQRRRKIRRARLRWKKVLKSVHAKRNHAAHMNRRERAVFEKFGRIDDPLKFIKATQRKRLHFQLGQSNRFKEAIRISGKYLPEMERIFQEQGLPKELTRLPFVESSFNVNARSMVGASGIWQFIRSTGKMYLPINRTIDGRNDPLMATKGAAQFLKDNFDALGAWPLAVTAYNHGRKGMMRAVRTVGNLSIGDVIVGYKGPRFGYASRNFFPSLLAAVRIEKNPGKYFADIKRREPLKFVEVNLPHSVPYPRLVKYLQVPPKKFRELNPAFSRSVYRGRLRLPTNQSIRLPADWGKDIGGPKKAFQRRYREIPRRHKFKRQ